MRKFSLFALALVLVAAAVFLAVAYDGNSANAVPTAWDSFCGDCHNGSSGGVAPPAHTVPSHAAIMGDCTNCHSSVPAIDVGKCEACHGGMNGIVSKHPASACSGDECHGAAPTTTTEAQTTTTAGQTTTTAGQTTTTAGQTTTTAGQTTTTAGQTTTTTGATSTTSTSTTSTTVPSGQPSYTG